MLCSSCTNFVLLRLVNNHASFRNYFHYLWNCCYMLTSNKNKWIMKVNEENILTFLTKG